MVMLNDPASLPDPMWALVRYMATTKRGMAREHARAVLSPPSLLSANRSDNDTTFDWALRTLQELRLMDVQGEQISLSDRARDAVTDLATYTQVLRREVLHPELNTSIGETDSQSGPRDLVRALAWFLTCDPLGAPLGWDEVSARQVGAFAEQVGPPVVNRFRWDRFSYWAPALGFATPPVVGDEGGATLVPDCTAAVKQVLLSRWRTGDRVEAVQVVAALVEELPVLPGGEFSRALGLTSSGPQGRQTPAVSHALLRGNDEGWLDMQTRSDAAREVLLADLDTVSGSRRVTDILIVGN